MTVRPKREWLQPCWASRRDFAANHKATGGCLRVGSTSRQAARARCGSLEISCTSGTSGTCGMRPLARQPSAMNSALQGARHGPSSRVLLQRRRPPFPARRAPKGGCRGEKVGRALRANGRVEGRFWGEARAVAECALLSVAVSS